MRYQGKHRHNGGPPVGGGSLKKGGRGGRGGGRGGGGRGGGGGGKKSKAKVRPVEIRLNMETKSMLVALLQSISETRGEEPGAVAAIVAAGGKGDDGELGTTAPAGRGSSGTSGAHGHVPTCARTRTLARTHAPPSTGHPHHTARLLRIHPPPGDIWASAHHRTFCHR